MATVLLLLLLLDLLDQLVVVPLSGLVTGHVLEHGTTRDAALLRQVVCADVIVD